ncbi:MAG: hypothetical protein JOZ13_05365 [Alphaproteobacteria bacterium]|nr:hypothetical protein [Alphaproteobacteria bacterium]
MLLATMWGWLSIILGAITTGVTAIVTANAKIQFLSQDTVFWAGISGTIAAFALATVRPQVRWSAFDLAARILEKAIERYRADPSKDDLFLVDAIDKGIDVLNFGDSN